MNALLNMTIVNMPSFLHGIVESQKLSLRFMRQELKRGAGRIRKHFIREQLQGPPGIKAGTLAKGKNIWTFVTGNTTKDLSAKIGISRILHVHEKGLTIHGASEASNRLLYLHEKGSGPRKTRRIIAAVEQVTIPPRLKFRLLVARDAPKELAKVAEAGSRGIQVAMTNALKRAI